MKEVLELEDVIVSTGDLFSIWHHPEAEFRLHALHARFTVYSELVPIDTPLFDTLNSKAIDMANKLSMPTLVTYPTFYRNAEAADSLEVLKCITTNTKMDVRYRSIQYVKDFYIHEPNHLVERIKRAAGRVSKYNGVTDPKRWVEGLQNIDALVAKCNYEWKKQPVSLPKMADNEFVALGKKCVAGWKRRFSSPVLGHKPTDAELKVYQDRLAYEMAVLKKMGFAG